MAKPAAPRSLAAMTMFVLTCGCSATADHPSLAPRAIERFTVVEATPSTSPAPVPAAIPEDASRQQHAEALAAQARTADDRFRASISEAETLVAKGSSAPPGSEAWVQAQQALSRADILREPVSRILADLDALWIGAAETGVGGEAGAALATTLRDIIAIDLRQREAITALRERLALP